MSLKRLVFQISLLVTLSLIALNSVAGQGPDDDHGEGVVLHELGQEGQPVHPGHLQIQSKDVGA